MNTWSKIAGILLVVIGFGAVLCGIYFDIVHLLLGGILDVVHGIKAEPTADGQIVGGVVKVLLSGAGAYVGVIIALGCWAGGLILMGVEPRRGRRRGLLR